MIRVGNVPELCFFCELYFTNHGFVKWADHADLPEKPAG